MTSKSKALLWLAVSFVAGYAAGYQQGVGWLRSGPPFVVWGNDRQVIVRTTPGQAHRVVNLAAEYCEKLGKLVVPTKVPADVMRTPGIMRFDCVPPHR